MLTAMNGHITVGALLEKYGIKSAGRTDSPGSGIWSAGLFPTIPSATSAPNRPAAIGIRPNGICSCSKFGRLVRPAGLRR